MSASLVGSEMCIRDSPWGARYCPFRNEHPQDIMGNSHRIQTARLTLAKHPRATHRTFGHGEPWRA
eukprot:14419655-Alexandrium_andersonii.AAC.1